MPRPERYDGEHQDLREEYERQERDDEIDQLQRDAGCDDQCNPDCDCAQSMIEDQQEIRNMEHDYWASRGLP